MVKNGFGSKIEFNLRFGPRRSYGDFAAIFEEKLKHIRFGQVNVDFFACNQVYLCLA